MSGKPLERRTSEFLGTFSLGLGVAQIAAPERINDLIGVRANAKSNAVQRFVGIQEISAGQGAFALSPPTPILWTRVAADVVHLGMLGKACANPRNNRTRLLATIGAVVAIGVVDALVAARYQARWPKEPTGADPLPTTRGQEEPMEEHYEGHPAITILATESDIRPRLREFEIEGYGDVELRKAPGNRGTEVIVKTTKKTDTVKAELRKVKQVIEVGEIVRSDAAPDGTAVKRQLKQRPGQPLDDKELEKAGRA